MSLDPLPLDPLSLDPLSLDPLSLDPLSRYRMGGWGLDASWYIYVFYSLLMGLRHKIFECWYLEWDSKWM